MTQQQAAKQEKTYPPRITVRWGIALAVLVTIAGLLIGAGDPSTGRVLSIMVMGGAVLLSVKVPNLGWGKVVLLFWFGFLMAAGAWSARTDSEERKYLQQLRVADAASYEDYVATNFESAKVQAALKAIDPDRYDSGVQLKQRQEQEALQAERDKRLVQLFEESPHQWLQNLQELNPDRYAVVMRDREGKIGQLDAEVKKVPASELTRNRDLYRELLALDPDNSRYMEKFRHYENLLKAERWKQAHCSSAQHVLSEAGLVAKDLVKQQLPAPRTAKFPSLVSGRHVGDCRFVVDSYVDSQNRFGAMIRTYYVATLVRTQSSWRLEDLKTR